MLSAVRKLGYLVKYISIQMFSCDVIELKDKSVVKIFVHYYSWMEICKSYVCMYYVNLILRRSMRFNTFSVFLYITLRLTSFKEYCPFSSILVYTYYTPRVGRTQCYMQNTIATATQWATRWALTCGTYVIYCVH